MTREEWLTRCTHRLHAQWPRVPDAQLEEVARELLARLEAHANKPEEAAHDWLRQGMPEKR
jgi:hypothetical protein